MFVILRPLGIEGKRELVGHGWKASLEGVETGKYGRKQEELLSLKWEKGSRRNLCPSNGKKEK